MRRDLDDALHRRRAAAVDRRHGPSDGRGRAAVQRRDGARLQTAGRPAWHPDHGDYA
jgi:hypothetical protein